MATRVYLPSSGAAAVTPSSWTFGAQADTTYTYAGVLTKGTTALTTLTQATGTTNPTHRGMVRYVIGPLAAQAISGSITGQIRCSESATGANATIGVAVKIIQPNGSDRAVLLSQAASDNTAATPPEMSSSLYTRALQDVNENTSITLTSQNASDGDYLVIELGWRSATGTNRNISLRVGDNSANDLSSGSTTTDTNDYAPWVEFSQTLSFITRPSVTTDAASSVSETTATGNGNMTATGNTTVDKRGVVYGTSSVGTNPGNVAPGSSGYGSYSEETGTFSAGAFTRDLTGLTVGQTYYLRAYAHNSQGYTYGDQVTFTTLGYVKLKASTNISASAADATTARLTAPSGKTSGAHFQAGKISDDTNPLPSIDLAIGKYTEVEFSIQLGSSSILADGDEIELRITVAGTGLNTYTSTPVITVGTAKVLSADPGSVSIAGSPATVAATHLDLQASPGSVTATGSAATLGAQYPLVASPGSVTAVGVQATVAKTYIDLQASPGSATVTGSGATLGAQYPLLASAGSVSANGQSATLTRTYADLQAEPGSVSVSGTSATLTATHADLQASPGSVTAIGSAATLGAQYPLAASPGAVAATGAPATVAKSYLDLQASPGSATATGSDASLLVTHTDPQASPGEVTISGQSVSLATERKLSLAPGAITASGSDTTGIATREASLSPGAVSISGFSADLSKASGEQTADPGSISIVGSPAGLIATRELSLLPGEVAATGSAVTLEQTLGLTASPGAVSISGSDAGAGRDLGMGADTGAVVVSGSQADFRVVALDNIVRDDPDLEEILDDAGEWVLSETATSKVMPAMPGIVMVTGVEASFENVADDNIIRDEPDLDEVLDSLGDEILSETETSKVLPARPGSVTATGSDATVNRGFVLDASPGNVMATWSPLTGSLSSTEMIALPGAMVLSGWSSESTTAAPSSVGAVAISGFPATMSKGYVLGAFPWALLMLGAGAILETAQPSEPCEPGSVAVTGEDATLSIGGPGIEEMGWANIYGEAAVIYWNHVLSASPALVVIAGQATGNPEGARLIGLPGEALVTGEPASLLYGRAYTLNAAPGDATITGYEADMRYFRSMAADPRDVKLSGRRAGLMYSGNVYLGWIENPDIINRTPIRDIVRVNTKAVESRTPAREIRRISE